MKRLNTLMMSGAVAAALIFAGCEDVRTEEYPSGKIRIQSTYVKDKKEGPEKEYYENGNVKREANYVNDRREGVVKEYYEDGTPEAEYNYADGYIEGLVTRYHKNGKVASKAEYKSLLLAVLTRILAMVTLTNGFALVRSCGPQKT